MKLVRNILIGVFGLVILLVVGAYIFAATYDREALKQLIQDQAEQITGRKLTIAGPLDLVILPVPTVTVEDVAFANAPWGTRPDMASLKRFELEIDPWALLDGALHVNRFILVEPDILLETDPSGAANWDIVAAEPTEEEVALPPLSVDQFIIERGSITYRDGPTGDQRILVLDNLEGSLPGPLTVALTAEGRVDEMPLSLDVALEGAEGEFVLSRLNVTLGPNVLSGSGSLSLAGSRPKVTAAFASPLIDLRDLGLTEMPEEPAPLTEAGPESPYVFTPDPLPLDGLKTLDLDARISVERIRLSETIDITGARLALTIDAGDLTVSEIKGAAFGGTVDGRLRLNAAADPAQLTVKIAADDMNYGAALSELGISRDVAGTIDLMIDLGGRGTSMRQIASSLSGQTQIVAENGTINNKLLAVVSTGLSDILGPLMGGKQDTNLKCFVSHFDIAAGIAASRAFVVDSATFTLEGGGTVNLRDESLKLAFDTQTREAALVSLAVPFRITGTLASPSAKPDAAAAVKGVLGAAKALGIGGGETQQAEKPKSKVKSLFGGLAKKYTGQPEQTAPEPAPAPVAKDSCAEALAAIGR